MTFGVNVLYNKLVYIGHGDLHEHGFDLVYSTSFYDFEQIVQYSAVERKEQEELEYCRYRYLVFPSQELEDQYLTKNPLIYALTKVV